MAIKTMKFLFIDSSLAKLDYMSTVVIQGQKPAVLSIRFLYPRVSQEAHSMSSPLTVLLVCTSATREPICLISFINDVPSVSVTSLMVVVILPVIRTAQKCGIPSGVSHTKHCQAREAVEAPANFQQLSQPGPHVVENGA